MKKDFDGEDTKSQGWREQVKWISLGLLVVGLIFVVAISHSKRFGNENGKILSPGASVGGEELEGSKILGDIVGGVQAGANNFRMMASVQFRRTRQAAFAHDCGGSLLSGRSVLTAGHCCDGRRTWQLQVVLGEHNVNVNSGLEVIRRVSAITVHPNYLFRNNLNPDRADVCVLTLRAPAVQTNRQIQFVTLANQGRAPPPVGHTATVIGWGRIRSGGPLSNVLRRVEVGILSDQTCIRQYANNFIERNMICAGGPGADSCQGDSGGPMFATSRNRLVQVGIVSWGIGCARPNQPGVYAEVSFYANWIRRQIVN